MGVRLPPSALAGLGCWPHLPSERHPIEAGKPDAATCHAAPTLVEAEGRILISRPSLPTDIGSAGGIWVDEEVHVDAGLVTSGKPDDLEAFCPKTIEEFKEGTHDTQSAG